MSKSSTLYHYPFDPHSRLARLALGEKKVQFQEVIIKYWDAGDVFVKLNPSGVLPVLAGSNGEEGAGFDEVKICENYAILEYLEEAYPAPSLWPLDIIERAEARRMVSWFERKFDFEVNALLLFEKMEKRLFGKGSPDMNVIRAGRESLRDHLRYFEGLLEVRNWFAGRVMSYADLAGAAHLSILDYFDEIVWEKYPHLKTWYMVVKSRPCFRPILNDNLPGLAASAHYKELDF